MARPLDLRSDAALLRAARRDSEAFGVFYDRHSDAVLGFFARRTSDAQTAADLTAQTFASRPALSRHPARPRRCGCSLIARHQLSSWTRREAIEDRARRRLGISQVALTEEPPLERIDTLAGLDYVRKALDQLPDGLAKAVSLRVADELPYPDVALALGVPRRRPGCVSRVARAV